MDSSDKNRVEGATDKFKGGAKETLGDVRNDEDQQAEGKADQTKGDAKQGLADVKDKVSDVIKKATN